MKILKLRFHSGLLLLGILATTTNPARISAADPSPIDLYKELKTFRLAESGVKVQDFMLARDSLEMVFTGNLYFTLPSEGGVYGAVFMGQGRFRTETKVATEGESVKRFLNSTIVESTFTKAVLRFTDDTYQKFANHPASGPPPPEALKLVAGFEERLVRETGLNLTSRLLLAIVNKDNPGVFFIEMDGGSRGRFSALMDHQARIPADVFDINAGEKGMIFKHEGVKYGTDIWTAFYDQQDFQRGVVRYSDAFDLVSIPMYRMDIDLRDPGHWLRMQVQMDLTTLADNVRIIPMNLNQGLVELNDERKNKAVHVVSAELEDGRSVGIVQEEWETGVSLILPEALAKGQKVNVKLKLEGKDSLWTWGNRFHYPRSTTSWYPRHGYLVRSRFQITFHHNSKARVASIGQRVREESGQGDEWLTEWHITDPVAIATFVCGPFQRRAENVDVAGKQIPIEYYSPPGDVAAIKEDFLIAEVGNAIRYFDNIFGKYPYGRLGAAFFPTNYGQGFPTLLLLPVRGTADRAEFAFLAHENAHQWWGHIVGWRSYRDQWLSEGFAEYSGILYVRQRTNAKDQEELIRLMRRDMVDIPPTSTGAAKIKLHEAGPLILGHRLHSTRSGGASQLIYSKGALVLRMLHFLLSDPEKSDDSGFFTMMKDFVARHQNGVATSESFIAVAGEHFARSPIGRKYGMRDLGWFLNQWVYQTGLPSYQLEYKVEAREGGGFALRGNLIQENVPNSWGMPVPVVLEFSGGRLARTSVAANGPKAPFEIRLPEKPQKVRLDPELWVLSEKTSEKGL